MFPPQICAADHRVDLGRFQARSLTVAHLHAVEVGHHCCGGRDRAEFAVLAQHHVGIVNAVDEVNGSGGDAGQGVLDVDGPGEGCGQLEHC